jgi:hypothetical protein
LEKVSIGLVKLPFQLVEAGVRSAQIMGEIRSTMERDAGLSIVDEDAEAHVVFKVKSASHGGPRGVVGFVIFVSVRQDVIIDRLEGEPLRLPTMLHTKLAIVPERSLASRFTTEARLAMEELAGLIVRAKQQRVSPIGN